MSGMYLQQSEVRLPDGSSFFRNEGGDTMHLSYFECDNCRVEAVMTERWNAWAFAGGSGYWAQVMWFCPACGPKCGGSPPEWDPNEEAE